MSRRPPPARDRGPRRVLGPQAARLADRAAGTDRHARFGERLRALQEARRRRARRHRLLVAAVWTSVGAVALVVGWWRSELLGLVLASGATAAAYLGWRLAGTVASRRGASAWDWRAQRYRLYGDPSAQVQALDDPDERATGHLAGRAPNRPRRRS